MKWSLSSGSPTGSGLKERPFAGPMAASGETWWPPRNEESMILQVDIYGASTGTRISFLHWNRRFAPAPGVFGAGNRRFP
jgi:hypothetical protein